MKAIIIGAGRGQRLMPHTADAPKCFAEVQGRRILDWALEALSAGGLSDVVFIGGYRIDSIREAYPAFTVVENTDWPNNNIMMSLMYARDWMAGGFVCSYADILYRPRVVEALMRHPQDSDITLVCDTAWRARYDGRTEHPEDDAEKIAVDGAHRVTAINRTMPSAEARGEYIGVARFSPTGAAALLEHFDRARERHGEGAFQAAKSFKKAYLIDLFQEMLDAGVPMQVSCTEGGYMEIDTNQDFHHARARWSDYL